MIRITRIVVLCSFAMKTTALKSDVAFVSKSQISHHIPLHSRCMTPTPTAEIRQKNQPSFLRLTSTRKRMKNNKGGDDVMTKSASSSVINDDEFVEMQQKLSSSIKKKSNYGDQYGEETTSNTNLLQFLQHQAEVFDEFSSFFNSSEACPPEVQPLLHFIVSKFLTQIRQNKKSTDQNEEETYKIVDVGCGTGVLFPFFMSIAHDMSLKEKLENDIKLQIMGVDLSSKMIQCAQERVKSLIAAPTEGGVDQKYNFELVANDFVSLILDNSDGDSDVNEAGGTNGHVGKYDGVMVNACFGNFLDTDAIMTALAKCVKVGGIVCIAHPLGREFVQRLHEEDPNTVPHNLPTPDELETLAERRSLKVLDFISSIDVQTSQENQDEENEPKHLPIYYASSIRTET
mmetsp:Transcript_16807/g.24964  ORF Transcript_16807/g.24964 Transcript_16807/m.24964 type:complete len:401 (+) Transcript_16807:213-1415(+)